MRATLAAVRRRAYVPNSRELWAIVAEARPTAAVLCSTRIGLSQAWRWPSRALRVRERKRDWQIGRLAGVETVGVGMTFNLSALAMVASALVAASVRLLVPASLLVVVSMSVEMVHVGEVVIEIECMNRGTTGVEEAAFREEVEVCPSGYR